MPADHVTARQLRAATERMDECRALMASGSRNAVIWCREAAEALAKAVLQAEVVYYGRERRVGALAGMLPPGHAMAAGLAALSALDAYGEDFGFPDADGRVREPPSGDVLAAMAARTEAALARAAALLGVDPEGGDAA